MRLGRLIITALYIATSALYSQSVHAELQDIYWPQIHKNLFGDLPINNTDQITITGPRGAENAAQVPITIKLPAVSSDLKPRVLHIVVDANPKPLVASYRLGKIALLAGISTRIRMENDSRVRVIMETEDGKLYSASTVIHAGGGCAGSISVDEEAIASTVGKIKIHATPPFRLDQPVTTSIMIKHPMLTGLQKDSKTGTIIPEYYLNQAEISFNQLPVMVVNFGLGTAEDPHLTFTFKLPGDGELAVNVSDNRGNQYSQHQQIQALIQ